MSGKTKADLEAENTRLREENEALYAFAAAVEATAGSAPPAVYDDRDKLRNWQTDILTRMNVIAGLVAGRVNSPGFCAEQLAGYAARPVPYRIYATETTAMAGEDDNG